MKPDLVMVSGGQTGADRAALDWAIKNGFPHGGWCRKGRKAEDGMIPSAYQLQETPDDDSLQRTEWNVRDADGTVILSLTPELSGGSRKTEESARAHKKPVLHLHAGQGIEVAGAQLREFVQTHGITRLNVAGPRQSEEPEIGGFVRQALSAAFLKGNAATRGRLASLDALRGLDMFWIVGGSAVAQALAKASGQSWLDWVPVQMKHVPWDGFHFIDLIFPLFLFMIGVAIPYALGKRRSRGDRLVRIYGHVFFRVAVMIVLGMMVNGSLLTFDPSKFELTYSVLQMLALGYLVATILFLHLGLRSQIIATVGMLVGYWVLLAFVPGPGHELGRFQEGCNVGDWVTEYLFGKWRGHQIGWVVGILGHASTAMLGVFAGQLLRSGLGEREKLRWLAVLGAGCLLAGVLWSGWLTEWFPGAWSRWPIWFPIIKVRWTSSYVLYAGGMSFLLLALSYLIIDVLGYRRWAVPFMAIGVNSIFAYMAWSLCSSAFRRVSEVFLGGLKPYVGPWHEAILAAGALAVLWALLGYMYRKGTLIRI